jgi:large subunit ribosomal protein L9
MKVILNKDLSTLGEEGDVRDVARGYARNYLFPRGIALPYTPKTAKLFEARADEIEARKVQKRQDASGLKERLESLELSITMPAGANGKLYGAVTSQTLVDELTKLGFQIERKRIEIPGNNIKNAGKYKAAVKLYENSSAAIQITVIGHVAKTETPQPQQARGPRRRREPDAAQAVAPAEPVPAQADTASDNSQSMAAETGGE